MRDCRGVRICAKCYLGICGVSRLIFIRPIRVIRVQKNILWFLWIPRILREAPSPFGRTKARPYISLREIRAIRVHKKRSAYSVDFA